MPSFMKPAEISSLINKKDTVPQTVNDNESKYEHEYINGWKTIQAC